MQNILVPTDFSNNAYHALYYATKLLKTRECNFFLLNVYEENKNTDDGDHLQEKSNARLERTIGRIQKNDKNTKHTFRLISQNGKFIKVVHSLIDQLEIDLVVMGNKGKKSSIPIFLGSTAIKTLESVKKCPVLTVPKKAEIKIPKEVAYATDYKRPFDAKVIEPIRFMTSLWGAAIRIVHINEEEQLNEFQQSNQNKLMAYLDSVEHSFHWTPNFISKTKVIQIFVEEMGIDIIAMVNYEHGILEKMLREPVIEKMIFKIDIPFLVIPSFN